MEAEISNYYLTRLCLQKGLAIIYLIGFLIIINQYTALVGEKGLLPLDSFLKRSNFLSSPSLFWLKANNLVFMLAAFTGLLLSVLALTGISERYGIWFSVLVWFSLWLLYLSFVNFGQTFYGFGWEILLLEAGFLAIFLGSADTSPPVLVIWLYRWLLFRLMFGAGLIKIRGDECWRDLTCMYYHYETQPAPNPLSMYFHFLPRWFHKLEVLFTHIIELVIPFLYFIPRTIGVVAGLTAIIFQVILILSGNLAWLNYITIVIAFSCLDDQFLQNFIPLSVPETAALGLERQFVVGVLTILVAWLSIKPVKNLISSRQAMNQSFDNLHLVNTYGAFGSVTRDRYEVIIEGTLDQEITPDTNWQEYEFKTKPGRIDRRPGLMSPYLHKLDWQIWFAAMSPHYYHPWFKNLMHKLLYGDSATLKLLDSDPFQGNVPAYLRASLYLYKFNTDKNKKTYWDREYIQEYFPVIKNTTY